MTIEKCSICYEEREVSVRLTNNETICSRCYKKYYYKEKKKLCPICNKYKINVYMTDGILCCRNCNKKLHQEICDICLEKRPISKTIDGIKICCDCYMKQYKRKIIICSHCFKEKCKHTTIDNKEICGSCYKKYKYNTDENFRAKTLLRTRLNKAIKGLCLAPKFKISYKAIIEYLGPCPGNKEDYHIDHIKPLCSFNLTIQEEAEKAFAPENHRWLLAKENLKKGGRIL